MNVTDLLTALETSALGTYMREAAFGFIPVEIVHILAITLVFGSIAMVDLRLLGVTSLRQPVSALTKDLLPVTWIAFVLAVITGALLFMSNPSGYFYAFEFRMKMLLIALAGVNMLVFHLGPYRLIQNWDKQIPPPKQVRMFGLFSMLLWVSVIFFGRFIGFVFEMASPF